MPSYVLGILNGWEILALFAVFFLLFGVKKLPGLAKGLGQGIKEFKDTFRKGTEPSDNA